ncbi:MAG: DUF6461 domain-containing protein [Rhodococcus sp. (in: high G+C Gram-positive bacteria)]|uniref:DUF6461 domain-containing protein n=1 Tax=Rhodococcus sp. TaxID=1831 RepID=UPI002ADB4635|nr:DUF6461 domain-containing protein [Rhodococcus sp. (in: high G+C Gram-positive bacteria)]
MNVRNDPHLVHEVRSEYACRLRRLQPQARDNWHLDDCSSRSAESENICGEQWTRAMSQLPPRSSCGRTEFALCASIRSTSGPDTGGVCSRMKEIGLDPGSEGPSPDGKFHVIEASFAMAANYTGVQITPDFLSTSTFLAGGDD